MKFFVCVAGLPREVVVELKGRSPARFTEDKGNKLILRPVKQPYSYRDGMSDAYLEKLAGRFYGLSSREDVSVVLAYVDYGKEATSRFLRNFFPFALSAPLDPFYPDSSPKNERRRGLLRYVGKIERVVDGLRDRARVVRDVLSGQNFTPLLLPNPKLSVRCVGSEDWRAVRQTRNYRRCSRRT